MKNVVQIVSNLSAALTSLAEGNEETGAGAFALLSESLGAYGLPDGIAEKIATEIVEGDQEVTVRSTVGTSTMTLDLSPRTGRATFTLTMGGLATPPETTEEYEA